MRKTLVYIGALILLGSATAALAHSYGQSLEYKGDAYLVDVGYDSLGAIIAGEPLRFAFDLWKDKEKTDHLPFRSVWAQIIGPDKRVQFSGDIAQPKIGYAMLTFRFPKAGDYTLSVRYENEKEEDIATTTFPLTVAAGQTGGFSTGGAAELVAGIIIGGALVFFLLRKKS